VLCEKLVKAPADELPDDGRAGHSRPAPSAWVRGLAVDYRPVPGGSAGAALGITSTSTRGWSRCGGWTGRQLTPRRPKSRRTLRLAQIAVDALRRPDGNLLRSSLRAL
jgi:hypothetical protein